MIHIDYLALGGHRRSSQFYAVCFCYLVAKCKAHTCQRRRRRHRFAPNLTHTHTHKKKHKNVGRFCAIAPPGGVISLCRQCVPMGRGADSRTRRFYVSCLCRRAVPFLMRFFFALRASRARENNAIPCCILCSALS